MSGTGNDDGRGGGLASVRAGRCVLGDGDRQPTVDSRLDQVCLDVAPAGYEVEKSFWAELTGWRLHAGALAEFDLLKPPRGLPIRILLQRLGTDRASSAHVDLACSDIEAARSWHEQRGARVVGRWPHWIVMKDPAGGAYCLTARDPDTGRLRDGVPSEADPPAPHS